eukprot:Rmarinus@m.5200
MKVLCWGRGKNNRLASARETDEYSPQAAGSLDGLDVTRVSTGGGHSAALTKDGQIHTFGYGQYGQLGTGCSVNSAMPSRVTGPLESLRVAIVSCGRYHSAALTEDGEVYTWGGGKNGRLGHGDELNQSSPRLVESLANAPFNVLQLTCGYHSTAIVTDSGELLTCGWGAHGQLGHANCDDYLVLTKVEALRHECVIDVACGDRHALALTQTGVVYSWGSGDFGQLGYHTVTPERPLCNIPPEHSPLVADLANVDGGCSDDADGATKTWAPKPIKSLSGMEISRVICGDRHSAAISAMGNLFVWGNGDSGQLGLGVASQVDSHTPQLVKDLLHEQVTEVSCGHCHTVALTRSGRVYAWGNADYGQTGLGDSKERPLPTFVSALEGSKVVQISCGHFHTVALLSN